jgi:pimeloyl-ACP methyl ester carboxylesterase
MARRSCRERDGEVVFDYDMAIAEPFKAAGPVPKVDMWPFFEALAQKPLLAVRGEISVLLTAETFERMREIAPKASLVTVPSIGHAPDLNEPAALEAIEAFLNELPERLNRSSQSQAG